jgi:hypothetical protein
MGFEGLEGLEGEEDIAPAGAAEEEATHAEEGEVRLRGS